MESKPTMPADAVGTQAVPVNAARVVGQDHAKDVVVIITYAKASRWINAITWGREVADKEVAIDVRDKCLAALGMGADELEMDQDYRFVTEGERAKIIDKLVTACRAADHAIASVMVCREGITDLALQQVRDAIKSATDAA